MLQIISSAFYSVISLLVSWHEERWTFFSSMCESTFWFLQMVFKQGRLKEISVYHQHTVGVRGHALLWSSLCVRYGKVYNKCTMFLFFVHNLKLAMDSMWFAVIECMHVGTSNLHALWDLIYTAIFPTNGLRIVYCSLRQCLSLVYRGWGQKSWVLLPPSNYM